MKVEKFATPNPVALSEKDCLAKAAAIFLKNGIDGAPVINENGNIVGILTKAHLYRAIVSNISFDKKVELLMKRDVRTIHIDRPVEEAWQMAWEYNVGRLPVVNDEGKLVAIITRIDLVQAFEMLYQNLGAITEWGRKFLPG